MHHPIDHSTLRKAAEQLLTIDEAGYGSQLDRELFDATLGDQDFRLEQSRRQFSQTCGWADDFAARLASIVDCPISAARAVALELSGQRTKRSVALEMLPRLASEVQALQRRVARDRFAGRRAS